MPVQRLGGLQILPEGLLDDHAALAGASGPAELLEHQPEESSAEWPGSAPGGALGPRRFVQARERRRIAVVAVDVD